MTSLDDRVGVVGLLLLEDDITRNRNALICVILMVLPLAEAAVSVKSLMDLRAETLVRCSAAVVVDDLPIRMFRGISGVEKAPSCHQRAWSAAERLFSMEAFLASTLRLVLFAGALVELLISGVVDVFDAAILLLGSV